MNETQALQLQAGTVVRRDNGGRAELWKLAKPLHKRGVEDEAGLVQLEGHRWIKSRQAWAATPTTLTTPASRLDVVLGQAIAGAREVRS